MEIGLQGLDKQLADAILRSGVFKAWERGIVVPPGTDCCPGHVSLIGCFQVGMG